MSHEPLALPGLDGSTPLGFLAALGVLRVLSTANNRSPTMAWQMRDRWTPVYWNGGDLEEVIRLIAQDAALWQDAPILKFRYLKVEKNGARLVGGLRPPLAVLRRWLSDQLQAGNVEAVDYASALVSEMAAEGAADDKVPSAELLSRYGIAFDPNAPLDRSTMSTFFDFTSRNAQFLEQVDRIRSALDEDLIRQAIVDGKADTQWSITLDWDPAADAPGAIYGAGFSGLRPAAEWLAFRGIVFFPVVGRGSTLSTTGCRGRRKDGMFIWPLWDVPAGVHSIAALVRTYAFEELTEAARREIGIAQVFRAKLTKKADGYTGMFAPSEPV